MSSVSLYAQNEENKTGSMSWQCCSELRDTVGEYEV